MEDMKISKISGLEKVEQPQAISKGLEKMFSPLFEFFNEKENIENLPIGGKNLAKVYLQTKNLIDGEPNKLDILS